MKTYNKPEIIIENIIVEDILSVSLAQTNDGAFTNWDLGQTGNFDELWG